MTFVTSSGRLELIDGADSRPTLNMTEAHVRTHHHVADRYWLLTLDAPEIAHSARPGQFVMLTIAHAEENTPVLPRPMAIYETDDKAGTIDIMYGVVGKGTSRLTRVRVGAHITTVGPLGQHFTIDNGTHKGLILGRGIGTCSLTLLASEVTRLGKGVVAVESARSAHALIADGTYRRAGVEELLQVVDSDGTSVPERVHSTLRHALDGDPPQQVFTCGSRRLARLAAELAKTWEADLQVSLEAHMACGLGYCHGCASGTSTAEDESPLICRDGPVFRLHRVYE